MKGLPLLGAVAVLAVGAAVMASSAEEFIEVNDLDPREARIRRYAVTTRGAPGKEIELPGSTDHFCTIGQVHHLSLSYYPTSDLWIVQVHDNADAARAATGLIVCLNLAATR